MLKLLNCTGAATPQFLDLIGGFPDDTGKISPPRFVFRHQVGTTHSAELNPMLKNSLEAVGPGHVGTVIAPDVTESNQGTQRIEGSTCTYPLITASVNEL